MKSFDKPPYCTRQTYQSYIEAFDRAESIFDEEMDKAWKRCLQEDDEGRKFDKLDARLAELWSRFRSFEEKLLPDGVTDPVGDIQELMRRVAKIEGWLGHKLQGEWQGSNEMTCKRLDALEELLADLVARLGPYK